MSRRALPPLPIEGNRIKAHFEGMREMLYSQCAVAGKISPSVTGLAREWFVHEFLDKHLPGGLKLGTGHIWHEDKWSRQQDVIVHKDSSLSLPIGPSGLFFPDDIVACIEVKSQLSASDLVGSIKTNFQSLPPDRDILKVVVTYQLANASQSRSSICEGTGVQDLSAEQCPDLIIILDNAPIIQPKRLKVVDEAGDKRLVKYGSYHDDKWLGLALLVFEMAQRQGRVPWKDYLADLLPSA